MIRLTPMFELYFKVHGSVSVPYPPRVHGGGSGVDSPGETTGRAGDRGSLPPSFLADGRSDAILRQ